VTADNAHPTRGNRTVAVKLSKLYFLSETNQEIFLPGVRAVMVLKQTRFAPGEDAAHEA
jgi:hypothetical protein